MALRLTSPPTVEPVSLDAVKLFLRVSSSTEDALLASLITAARFACENRLGRALISTGFEQTFDAFADRLPLQRPPLLAVSSIRYVDVDGVTQTLSSADYQVDDRSWIARILPAYGASWPSTRDQANAVTVAFTAGYAAPITAVDAAADTITVSGWRTLAAGDPVVLSIAGGQPPPPLNVGKTYWVQSVVAAGVYKVAATVGGSAVDLTTAGWSPTLVGEVPAPLQQWILLAVGEMYENRERSAEKPLVLNEFVDALLDTYRVLEV